VVNRGLGTVVEPGSDKLPQFVEVRCIREEWKKLGCEEGTFEQFLNNHFEYYWPLFRRTGYLPSLGNHEYYTNNALGPATRIYLLAGATDMRKGFEPPPKPLRD
jgi:hypothetical protein